MGSEYFLGANSRDGFFSLYGEFCRGRGDFLHIIKGGPGTGKSGFMRKIAAAAESRGLDVEYVLCSGDPDSLDGIYMPELGLGWVDGTAPHAAEPEKFGIDSDYVNLGAFCNTPLTGADNDYVNLLYELYREKYRAAYDCLKSASLLRRRALPPLFTVEHTDILRARVKEILRLRAEEKPGSAPVKRRFYHAVCCKGELYLKRSVNSLCKQIYEIGGEFTDTAQALRIVAEEAGKYADEIILGCDPRDPDKLDALLIPGLELAFVGRGWEFEGSEEIILDSMLPREKLRELRPHIREINRLEDRIMGLACAYLAQAKELHDELEDIYKSAMDFRALDEFTGDCIETYIR